MIVTVFSISPHSADVLVTFIISASLLVEGSFSASTVTVDEFGLLSLTLLLLVVHVNVPPENPSKSLALSCILPPPTLTILHFASTLKSVGQFAPCFPSSGFEFPDSSSGQGSTVLSQAVPPLGVVPGAVGIGVSIPDLLREIF